MAEGRTLAGSVPYLAAVAVMHKETVLVDARCAAARGIHGLLCMGYCDEVLEDLVDLIGHRVLGKLCFSLSLS